MQTGLASPETADTEINVFHRDIRRDPKKELLAKHRLWMDSIQHEYPLPSHPFKIGVYIRYYNQTRHENYIEQHKKKFASDIALCPNWKLVDYYIDPGSSASRMENSKEWCRLLEDCFSGKVDLIVTQLVRNISNDPDELALISRLLASQKKPVGIYFVSEDIYTLGTYYRMDMKDMDMFPEGWRVLPDDELDVPMINGPASTGEVLTGA